MAAPVLQTQIDIDAPVAKVWALISDLSRMPQWSPQCRVMKPLGPLRQGTRTVNLNRRNYTFWPTTSTVTGVIPEKKLAFRVKINHTIWSYELEPTDKGTPNGDAARRERRHGDLEHGDKRGNGRRAQFRA
jgi:uncharacterized protein YndB with AHSA1/START domain